MGEGEVFTLSPSFSRPKTTPEASINPTREKIWVQDACLHTFCFLGLMQAGWGMGDLLWEIALVGGGRKDFPLCCINNSIQTSTQVGFRKKVIMGPKVCIVLVHSSCPLSLALFFSFHIILGWAFYLFCTSTHPFNYFFPAFASFFCLLLPTCSLHLPFASLYGQGGGRRDESASCCRFWPPSEHTAFFAVSLYLGKPSRLI